MNAFDYGDLIALVNIAVTAVRVTGYTFHIDTVHIRSSRIHSRTLCILIF